MAAEDDYGRRADDLLRAATRTSDLGERARLIREALHWREEATEDAHENSAAASPDGPGADDPPPAE